MSEMIERVARASFACWRTRMDELGHHLDKGRNFEDMSESESEFAIMNARAVIEAMREPSKAMMDAGRPWAYSDKLPPNCWIKMIDAALK